jgi:hypothetical protein
VSERLAERAPEHFMDQRLFEEPHLGFRGVDVDIDAVRRDPQEQVHLGASLLDGGDAVRLDDRVRDRPVLDDPAVDEHVLHAPGRPLVPQGGGVALDAQSAGLLAHLDQVGPVAEQLKEPLAQVRDRRALQQTAAAAGDGEAHLRVAECELRRQPRDLGGFRRVGLQELAPRRQIVEEVRDLDAGAFGGADLADRGDRAGVHLDFGPALGAARARAHREMRDRGDAGQRLAAEPEGVDRAEIRRVRDLARGVPLDRQPGIVGVHAGAVVLDPDQSLAAELHRNGDAPRACVERVLDEFLDD